MQRPEIEYCHLHLHPPFAGGNIMLQPFQLDCFTPEKQTARKARWSLAPDPGSATKTL